MPLFAPFYALFLLILASAISEISAKPDYTAQSRVVRSAGQKLQGDGRYNIRNLATGQSLTFQRNRVVNFVPVASSSATIDIQVSLVRSVNGLRGG